MENVGPISCPDCDVVMNAHAEKVDYFATSDAEPGDADLGGFLDRIYACPECGGCESRRLEP